MSRESINSIPETVIDKPRSILIKNNQGVSSISEAFNINQNFLLKLPDLGTIREGDEFKIVMNPDGSGILTKLRIKVERGERPINHSYNVPKEEFIVDKPKKGVNEKRVVRDFLSESEKNPLIQDDIFRSIIIGTGFIEYKGNKISINTKSGYEEQVQYLLSQMIIRGLYDQKKGGIIKQIRELRGISYYENDNNDIQAKNGYLLDTTMASQELLLQLFSFGNKIPGNDLQKEQKVVADLLVNFVNGIIRQEYGNKEILAKL